MTYELRFLPSALKEWKKLDSVHREQLKRKLQERLLQPRVPGDRLHRLKDCYKLKLRSAGLRLVYRVDDTVVTVTVVAVGRREGFQVYEHASRRLDDA